MFHGHDFSSWFYQKQHHCSTRATAPRYRPCAAQSLESKLPVFLNRNALMRPGQTDRQPGDDQRQRNAALPTKSANHPIGERIHAEQYSLARTCSLPFVLKGFSLSNLLSGPASNARTTGTQAAFDGVGFVIFPSLHHPPRPGGSRGRG